MKKSLICIFLVLVMMLTATVCAESSDALYESITASDCIRMEDLAAMLEGVDSENEEVLKLQAAIPGLMSCSGAFLQDKDESASSGKTYYAEVEFYIKNGEIYCSVDYNGYMGKIADAPVEALENSEYLFVSHPTGTYFTRDQTFLIEFSAESLHIAWGEGTCEYVLKPGNGSAEELESKETPFVETETYEQLTAIIRNACSPQGVHFAYDEENKEMFAYIEIGENARNNILMHPESIHDSWQKLIDAMLPYTEKFAAIIELATREDIMAVNNAKCTIVIVGKVNSKDEYYAQDTLCIMTNGSVVYSVMDDALAASGKSSGINGSAASGSTAPSTATATTEEKNALRNAKAYLDFMPFSYSGLVEQLEYEGYSHSAAVYGADYCGADWYKQAVKKAASYMDMMAFSYNGLVEQLEYEGFTHAEAVYGVDANW